MNLFSITAETAQATDKPNQEQCVLKLISVREQNAKAQFNNLMPCAVKREMWFPLVSLGYLL